MLKAPSQLDALRPPMSPSLQRAPDHPTPLHPFATSPVPVMFGPNISGEVQLERPLLPVASIKTGPFSTRWAGSYRQSFEGSYRSDGNDTVVFDAGKVSSAFGKGTTVQPPALYVLPCIKI